MVTRLGEGQMSQTWRRLRPLNVPCLYFFFFFFFSFLTKAGSCENLEACYTASFNDAYGKYCSCNSYCSEDGNDYCCEGYDATKYQSCTTSYVNKKGTFVSSVSVYRCVSVYMFVCVYVFGYVCTYVYIGIYL